MTNDQWNNDLLLVCKNVDINQNEDFFKYCMHNLMIV